MCRAPSDHFSCCDESLGVFIRPHLPSPCSPDALVTTQTHAGSQLGQVLGRPGNKPVPSGIYLTGPPLSLPPSPPPSFALKNLIRPPEEPPGRTAGTRDRNSPAETLSLPKPPAPASVRGEESGEPKVGRKFRTCPCPHETPPPGPEKLKAQQTQDPGEITQLLSSDAG